MRRDQLSTAFFCKKKTPMRRDQLPAAFQLCSLLTEERAWAGMLSSIWWRRKGVKYTNNEIYLDVIEEIDCRCERPQTLVA
jgi:hypothetical protein